MQWGLSQRELAAVQGKSKRWQAQTKIQDNLFKHHKKLFFSAATEHWNMLPRQSVTFFSILELFNTHLDSALHTPPVWPCFEQEGWTRGFPDIATNLNHCVIYDSIKRLCYWHLVTHPGPMPLTAGLTDTCDYNPNVQIHVSSAFPVSQQLPAHTPPWLTPKMGLPACQQSSTEAQMWSWEQGLGADTAGTAVLHSSSTCGTVEQSQWSTYKVRETFMTHHCCWGQKCAACPDHGTHTFMSSRNRGEKMKLI